MRIHPKIGIDMPKLQSPFVRKEINGKYVCIPEINKGYEWVFSKESIAVEKLDGTNISIVIKDGKITAIYNRKNLLQWWDKPYITEGILEAKSKKYFSLSHEGQFFGELIGPKLQGNPYKLEKHIWIPFSYAMKRLRYKFWEKFIEELENKTDREIYEKVSDLFKGLWSLFKRKEKQKFKEGREDENTAFEGMAAEGIVFYRKNTFPVQMAKLRRDMFEWFKGKDHNKKAFK